MTNTGDNSWNFDSTREFNVNAAFGMDEVARICAELDINLTETSPYRSASLTSAQANELHRQGVSLQLINEN